MTKMTPTLLGGALFAALSLSAQAVELKSQEDRYSYAAGIQMGLNMKRQSMDVKAAPFAAGIADALEGNTPKLTDEERIDALQKQQQAAQEKRAAEAAGNAERGRAFLEANKDKEGVVTLPSGLQYQILEEGEGDSPSADAQVTVHYRGTLIDGSEFDSSYARGEPATFSLKGVIKGFSEALSLMKKGSKWKVFIPGELAYGQRGPGPIGPNRTLIFDMELISFETPKPAQ